MTSGVADAPGRDDRVKRNRSVAVSIAALGLASIVACSPSQFVLREREATRALEQADAAQARALARYEQTLARQYLVKAREAAGEAHYALALDLAERSTETSRRARTLAMARATPPRRVSAE